MKFIMCKAVSNNVEVAIMVDAIVAVEASGTGAVLIHTKSGQNPIFVTGTVGDILKDIHLIEERK